MFQDQPNSITGTFADNWLLRFSLKFHVIAKMPNEWLMALAVFCKFSNCPNFHLRKLPKTSQRPQIKSHTDFLCAFVSTCQPRQSKQEPQSSIWKQCPNEVTQVSRRNIFTINRLWNAFLGAFCKCTSTQSSMCSTLCWDSDKWPVNLCWIELCCWKL